ncbi:DUF1254 domain-containing protein [Thermoleptolyngbya sichuanensis XZ-Cy5]|uniref:DUF1254 domain-containing protein n=1 Tax=Thermoleptolyngbya sichuanensis TaxID=2885951 RepID=UPI00240E8486|nr:DUF1254 domain-containing protein [Thermoleptolyngbya sichuanensis]MDG2618067.1 DUF1254 domain-containing protein [Thermoleptolyngbya sichuanensis XZ-Cy5]
MQNLTTQAQILPTTGSIDTSIGRLAFEGGYPTFESVVKLYDELDFQRAVQTYLWAIPLVSFAAWQEAYETVFGQQDGDLVLTTSFRDKLGLLTANATTPYVIGFLNLQRTGPLVIDYPKGQTAGGILDFWQRPITDMGLTGPDRGTGGKYLVIAAGQEVPQDAEGYWVVQSPTNNLFHAFRVLSTEPQEAEALTASYQVYSYAQRENPRKTQIIPAADKPWSGWPASNMDYWRLLAKMLNEEPVHERDRMMVAMLKPLGIEKGRPFQPDARQQKILEQAAIVGEATARCLSYAKRQPEAHIWPGTQWKNAVLLEANQETENHTALDERIAWFYEAVTLTAGMTTKTPGMGQQYIGIQKDKDGDWLQGGNNYSLRVPPHVPVKQFWSITLYDTETRCFIDTPHNIAGVDSRGDLIQNADGSIDLYFGPTAPLGQETNWAPTVPGRGWFAYFRFYAPTEPYFDRTWSLPDIEKVI